MVRATMSSSGSPFEACEYDHPPSPDRRTWPFGPPMKRMGPRAGPAAIARTIDNPPVLPSTQIPPLLGLIPVHAEIDRGVQCAVNVGPMKHGAGWIHRQQSRGDRCPASPRLRPLVVGDDEVADDRRRECHVVNRWMWQEIADGVRRQIVR